MPFIEILVKKDKISKEALQKVQASVGKDKSLEELLISNGVSEQDILEAKVENFGVSVKKVGKDKIPYEVLKYIPEESAKHYSVVPLGIEEGVLNVGMLDPNNIEARDALQFISSRMRVPFKVFLVSYADFKKIIGMYKGLTGTVTQALSEFETDTDAIGASAGVEIQGDDEEAEVIEEEEQITEDAPVTKIVGVMLRHATEGNASDIHIEHMGDKVRVRFRVDGELFTSLYLPKNVHGAVVARIKIMSNLKLDEKRKPQDGRFAANIDNRKVDFRVSTFPTHYGEKVVMRILDSQKGIRKLEELGMSVHNLAAIKRGIRSPHGLILITGPTGSGKSTTLYSMVNAVDREKLNVVSLENPVEYNIPGLSQSQVRPEIGYTFANGLRSILRQDPDVIMVGEIRDKETAQLAIQAALTGHLVFATLHTNSAIGAVPRLIDMGIDPYLIAPTLILSVAQRLARVLCPSSRKELLVDESIQMMLDKQFSDLPDKHKDKLRFGKQFYTAAPSAECPGGTRGRAAVLEIMEVDKEIERIILKDPTEPALWKIAREKGMLTMKEDAILKAFEGVVPFEEINKV